MSKKDILMKSLLDFYQNTNNMDILIQFVTKKSVMALRTLDWFSTNYTKYRKVIIDGVDIQCDYRQQLKGYQKEFFDPFRRKERILLFKDTSNWAYRDLLADEEVEEDDTKIVTTVGQMNFFRWAIRKGILKYIDDHIDDIQESQNKLIKQRKGKHKEKIIKPGSVISQTIVRFVVDFN